MKRSKPKEVMRLCMTACSYCEKRESLADRRLSGSDSPTCLTKLFISLLVVFFWGGDGRDAQGLPKMGDGGERLERLAETNV